MSSDFVPDFDPRKNIFRLKGCGSCWWKAQFRTWQKQFVNGPDQHPCPALSFCPGMPLGCGRRMSVLRIKSVMRKQAVAASVHLTGKRALLIDSASAFIVQVRACGYLKTIFKWKIDGFTGFRESPAAFVNFFGQGA